METKEKYQTNKFTECTKFKPRKYTSEELIPSTGQRVLTTEKPP